MLFERKTSISLPKWLTQGDMDCLVKTVLTLSNITNDYGVNN
ncbi:hypothetical protein GNIT_3679 [Glaciecola nitratireducens FR1064]|uniref:Uncharacterized protein n=1 Tax=Glaciecola nitratireducens (strain JCM 12485 / KCTC 12276 / FR1064) TaxID=1085623 RepID=G4QNG9_GLANF|nr:hypothetical protein GNIT_3679 [Glaciecola nitratireducens FR1064]